MIEVKGVTEEDVRSKVQEGIDQLFKEYSERSFFCNHELTDWLSKNGGEAGKRVMLWICMNFVPGPDCGIRQKRPGALCVDCSITTYLETQGFKRKLSTLDKANSN